MSGQSVRTMQAEWMFARGARYWWRVAASIIAAVPVSFFVLFAVTEGVPGWIHYAQAGLLGILSGLGWYQSRAVAYVLMGTGIGLAFAYPLMVHPSTLPTNAAVEIIFFVPMILSGLCFLGAAVGQGR